MTRKDRSDPQLALFDQPHAWPDGLSYTGDFISPNEESELVSAIATLPLAPFQFGAYEGKRRVLQFGLRYDFERQRLDQADRMPPWLASVAGLVERWAAFPPGSVQHALVTAYDTGAGIGWHRDRRPFEEVFGLSLGGACKLRFRRLRNAKWERFTLDAQPRSLYRMRGQSRSVWEHSILDVPEPRFSITFRTLARP
jgi:alkylated DNA repair dioxygenase AlkB